MKTTVQILLCIILLLLPTVITIIIIDLICPKLAKIIGGALKEYEREGDWR